MNVCQLFPLLEQEKNESLISENILKCVNYWVLNKQSVSDHTLSIITYLEKVQNSNNNKITSFYKLLISFFNYANEKFDLNDIQTILNMANKCIANQNSEDNEMFGDSYAESFLLIQFIVLNFSDKLDQNTLNVVSNLFKNYYVKYYKEFGKMYEEIEFNNFSEHYDDFSDDNEMMEEQFVKANHRLIFDKLMEVFLVLAMTNPKVVLQEFLQFEEGTHLPEEHAILKFTAIIDKICTGLDEFTQVYDKKVLIIAFSRLIEFFYNVYLESQNQIYYKILVNLISKTVLIIKYYRLKTELKMCLERKKQSRDEISSDFHQVIEVFTVLRGQLLIAHSLENFIESMQDTNDQPDFDYDFDDGDEYFFKVLYPKKVEILKDITSPIIQMNEIQEFSKVMRLIKIQNNDILENIYKDLDKVSQSHFKSTAFEYEILEVQGREAKEQIYRRIVKIKKRN